MSFFKNTILLIVSPTEGWQKQKRFNVPTRIILSHLFYPLLAILAISVFSQYFLFHTQTLSKIIQNSILDIAKYIFTYFITSYLVTGFFPFTNRDKATISRFNVFLIYNISILIILNILRNILPEFPFFEIIPLYIAFVIYKGCIYIDAPKQSVIRFTTVTSLLLLGLPWGIKLIFSLLIPDFSA
jgi:hypothetical protein